MTEPVGKKSEIGCKVSGVDEEQNRMFLASATTNIFVSPTEKRDYVTTKIEGKGMR